MKVGAIKADILSKSKNGVAMTEKEIYDVMLKNVRKFYGEVSPKEYIRTGHLGKSLKSVNGGLSARVFFNEGGMAHPRPWALGQSGRWHQVLWPEGKILDAAMHGSHGAAYQGTAIWHESMSELGDIEQRLVSNLRRAGLPI